MGEFAEDFGSYVCIKILEGYDQLLRTAFSDFKRKTFGRLDQIKGRARIFAELYFESLDHVEAEMQKKVEINDALIEGSKFSKMERAAFFLYFKWGFTMAEIAEVFGYSESGISQVLKRAKRHAIKVIKPEDLQSKEPMKRILQSNGS